MYVTPAQFFTNPFPPPPPPLERLVSALLPWAHFLPGKGYNNDPYPALLISFVLGKYSQCLKLGGEVER